MKYLNRFFAYLTAHKSPKNMLFPALALCVLLIVAFWWGRTNSQITGAGEQISALVGNVRTFYQNKPSAWGLNTYSAIQNGIVPKEMIYGRQIKNRLDKEVLLGADVLGNTVMPGNKTFSIVYKNLSFNECVDLASFAFDEKTALSVETVHIINETTTDFGWGSENPLPITASQADKFCKKDNDIMWVIYL